MKSGNQIRITAQLIDAITGHHIWAEKYDRELKELFDILDEITKKIVVALDVNLTGREDMLPYSKGTDNFEAWVLVSKGDLFFWRWTRKDNLKAREFYEQAIQNDPN